MRLIVDIEKFKADKVKYNKEKCETILASWTRVHNYFNDAYLRAKRKDRKADYLNQANLCMEQILRMSQVLADF